VGRSPKHRRAASAIGDTIALAFAFLLAPAPASAQAATRSPLATVTLTAYKPATAAVTIVSGTSQSLTGPLSPGATQSFGGPVSLETSWSLDPAVSGSLTLVAYFDAPAAALANGAAAIPSRVVQGRVATGEPTVFSSFTEAPVGPSGGAVGSAGGSLRLFTEPIGATNAVAVRRDNLELRLDLTGIPSLPAGAYAGTLNIRAIVQ
jgi:hypothetical protein